MNTHGREGHNIPCDLHNEHLNRRMKIILRNLQSNVQISTILRAAKTIGIVQNICNVFQKELRKSHYTIHK